MTDGHTTGKDHRRRILVVDDEPSIVDAVATSLRYEDFDVFEARDGRTAIETVFDKRPDLIVLDVMLPDLDGFEVMRRLRADGVSTPVLFLTARDALEDKVAGFSAGADDYVTKPFSLAEIVLRVRAILQRSLRTDAANPRRLVFADVEMDPDTHEAWRANVLLDLTATEFKLLQYFLSNPRRMLSKSQILDHVWNYDFDGDSNILETYVSYLRKKLNRHGPPIIQTVRLVGYTMRDPTRDG